MRALPQIPGAPDQLIRAVNERLRELESLIPKAGDSNSAALPSVGTPGRYTKVTTDAQGRVIQGGQLLASDLPGGGYPVGYAQIAYSSAALILTTTPADITNATLTLERAGRYLITGMFDVSLLGADTGTALLGHLVCDGSLQTQNAVFAGPTTNARTMICQQWIYEAAAAGKVVKLQGSKGSATLGTSQINTPRTSISALWISP